MTRMKTQSRIVLAGAVLLLALMALLADGAARRESVTFDEIAHIGAGVSYLQKLDMRMNEEHPPLAKALAAVPLVVRGVRADYSHLSWSFSGSGIFKQYLGEWVFGHWLIARWNDPIATVFWARQPMLILTLLLGLAIFLYGSRLGDPWGGLLCLCVVRHHAGHARLRPFGPDRHRHRVVRRADVVGLCQYVALALAPDGSAFRPRLWRGAACPSFPRDFSSSVFLHSFSASAGVRRRSNRQTRRSCVHGADCAGGVSSRASWWPHWSSMPSTLSSRGMSQPTLW